MKNIIVILILAVLITFCNQTSFAVQIVKFTATDASTQKSIKIDSILVKNITKNMQKTLTVDSVDIDVITGVDENNYVSNNPQFVINNYPNPFENTTDFQVYKSTSSNVTIALYDLLGNLILTKNEFLDNGIHNFTLNGAGLQQGAYFLKITDGSNQNYIKLIKTGNTSGSNPSISYSGANNSEIVYKGMDNGSRILIYNNNIFTFTCYSKNYWTLISGEKTVTELSANNVVNFLRYQ